MASDPPTALPGCVLHEDEHLLVVNKPAGWNTHRPGPYAGEGIYDWLKHRVARWARLAIVHRLDKETSGVMVFGKTPQANRSLTEQFARRAIHKKYLLLTDRPISRGTRIVKTKLIRRGDRYASGPQGELAETHFRLVDPVFPAPVAALVEAAPLTGRTHQIRVHAAECGFPVLGDTLYGGTPAARVYLHAAELGFTHPVGGKALLFEAPMDFSGDPRQNLVNALSEANATNAFRHIHGASDGWPGWYVDRLGDFVLSQASGSLEAAQRTRLAAVPSALGVYHKPLSRHVHLSGNSEAAPRLLWGTPAPDKFSIRENGVQFELGFTEGYSIGLFLDQRDNRRRLLAGHIAAGFPLTGRRHSALTLLNTFAYTCGFSVCAALTGAQTTSLDLSRKYLEWGRRNFLLNGLNPAAHEFIYGDTFDWLRRLAKKHRVFDVVVLDPPTFSRSKAGGLFRAEKDYEQLVSAALPVLASGGVLLASTNAARLPPDDFLAEIKTAVRKTRRRIEQEHYVPQPPDFPISRFEPAYLKTVWLRVS